mmetsp:Transcript_59311/g.167034  ORF Transcript_59311/g.167034 Transcript_59311/m.167034 type:complete len:204 (+) Transcript_59311:162-773(+)
MKRSASLPTWAQPSSQHAISDSTSSSTPSSQRAGGVIGARSIASDAPHCTTGATACLSAVGPCRYPSARMAARWSPPHWSQLATAASQSHACSLRSAWMRLSKGAGTPGHCCLTTGFRSLSPDSAALRWMIPRTRQLRARASRTKSATYTAHSQDPVTSSNRQYCWVNSWNSGVAVSPLHAARYRTETCHEHATSNGRAVYVT